LRVRSPGDFALGVAFASLACAALYLLKDLSAGTMSSMGPAYFPRMLAILLLALSGAMIAKSLFVRDENPLRARALPVVYVVGGTVFFGIAAESLGVLVTGLCMVVIYSRAYPGRRLRETVLLAIGSALFAAVLFVKLLGLTLTIGPRFMS
jgi:hypothetical protein